jgi:hypothetical protein
MAQEVEAAPRGPNLSLIGITVANATVAALRATIRSYSTGNRKRSPVKVTSVRRQRDMRQWTALTEEA